MDLTLTHIQNNLPWSVAYSNSFVASPVLHKDTTHALLHIMKSVGKLADNAEAADHGAPAEYDEAKVMDLCADLVICALRIANTTAIPFNLLSAVVSRLERKNGVKL